MFCHHGDVIDGRCDAGPPAHSWPHVTFLSRSPQHEFCGGGREARLSGPRAVPERREVDPHQLWGRRPDGGLPENGRRSRAGEVSCMKPLLDCSPGLRASLRVVWPGGA